MREIKFRAWDKRKKRMVFSAIEFETCLLNYPDKRKTHPDNPQIGFDEFEYQWFIIEQFTGLKDKNGVEIYEGDLIQSSVGILTVGWNNGFASFCLDKEDWMFSHFFKESIDSNDCEVIGNIHENKDLLK